MVVLSDRNWDKMWSVFVANIYGRLYQLPMLCFAISSYPLFVQAIQDVTSLRIVSHQAVYAECYTSLKPVKFSNYDEQTGY